MKKYLELTCSGYKGGELGRPKCFDSIEECIGNIDDLFYILDKSNEYNFKNNWPPDVTVIEHLKTYLEEKLEAMRPSYDVDYILEYWELDTETNKLTELCLDDIMNNFDINKFKLLYV